MQFSFYSKYNDRFWFTFFHEAAHVLLHPKDEVFLEDGHLEGAEEDEANDFSADYLIPPDIMTKLRENPPKSPSKVKAIAKELGIHPGIVVGRLQHEKLIAITSMNDLKTKLSVV